MKSSANSLAQPASILTQHKLGKSSSHLIRKTTNCGIHHRDKVLAEMTKINGVIAFCGFLLSQLIPSSIILYSPKLCLGS